MRGGVIQKYLSVDREAIGLLFHFNGDMTTSSVCVFRFKPFFTFLIRLCLLVFLSVLISALDEFFIEFYFDGPWTDEHRDIFQWAADR